MSIKKIVIGNKLENKKYDFRETCFGICLQNEKLLLVKKNEQFYFIGGGKDLLPLPYHKKASELFIQIL